jgi:hypothetical protein
MTLYGPGGSRKTDPRVAALVDENEPGIQQTTPMKRLIRLLREIHIDYNERYRPEGPDPADVCSQLPPSR